MKILRALFALFILAIITILACRRSLVLDNLIKKPEVTGPDNRPLISGIELVKPNGSSSCHPCNCKIEGNSGNLLKFAACDSLQATIKIKTDSKDWDFKLTPGTDTFFKVTRKTGDSINYLSIMTRHITSTGQRANLNIIAPDADGKPSIVYSVILLQDSTPLTCLKTTACNQTNQNNCQTCATSQAASTSPCCVTTTAASSSAATTASSATAPTYIVQATSQPPNNQKAKTDTLVLCKNAGGNKVYLAIETATKIACHSCTQPAGTANPCNTQNTATSSMTNNICPPSSSSNNSPSKECVNRYSDDEVIWIASAHSTGDWLKIKGLETVDCQNAGNSAVADASTSVQGTKKIKFLEVQATENTTNNARNDGLIEFRVAGGASMPVFIINVYQKK